MSHWTKIRLRLREDRRTLNQSEKIKRACEFGNDNIADAYQNQVYTDGYAAFLTLQRLVSLLDVENVSADEIHFEQETVEVPIEMIRLIVGAWEKACKNPDDNDFREFAGTKGDGRHASARKIPQYNWELYLAVVAEAQVRYCGMSDNAAREKAAEILQGLGEASEAKGAPKRGRSFDTIKRAHLKWRDTARRVFGLPDRAKTEGRKD